MSISVRVRLKFEGFVQKSLFLNNNKHCCRTKYDLKPIFRWSVRPWNYNTTRSNM